VGKKDVFERSSAAQINGACCLPWMWGAFNKSRSAQGKQLFLEQILDNIGNLSVPAGSSHFTLIEELAARAQPRIAIEGLSEELKRTTFPRGNTVWEFVGNILDQIVRNYPDLEWWISEKGLNIGAKLPPKSSLSKFDELAGRLLAEARKRHAGKYLPRAEYGAIARALDEAGMKPLDHIAGRARQQLADWYKMHPRSAFKTFEVALNKGKQREFAEIARAIKKSYCPS
jgi:hypothetical protein